MKEITLETIFNVLVDFKEETYNKFNCLEKRVDSLENTVTKMEHEHGEKLAALCDNITVNNEKHEEFSERLDRIESKLFNHDIRVEILEERVPQAL